MLPLRPRSSNEMRQSDDERPDLHSGDRIVLRSFGGVCAFLRTPEVRWIVHVSAAFILTICALTLIYLFYALLRPEKF
jgi:K+-transporting ATPase KdpF subunit